MGTQSGTGPEAPSVRKIGKDDPAGLNVIGINRKSIFTFEEARTLFPMVFRLTKGYSERVQHLIEKIDSLAKSKMDSTALIETLEIEASQLVQEWQTKIQKLGGMPNGHWVVDFDSGDGYFCWKYPEPAIAFWHHYRDGFSKRIKLSTLHPLSEIVAAADTNPANGVTADQTAEKLL